MVDPAELACIPLFGSLSDSERQELATWFEVRTVGEGVKLASEGAWGYSFYVLLEGSAVVEADGATMATYAPGDFFGEMAILDGSPRSATVTTTSSARLLVMFGTEFRDMEQSQPTIAAELERVTRERRRELHDLAAGAAGER
jgi:CRP-like cAMP-binding protein